jgi:dinuclear metal center YbgI/SA1388 family protein
MDAELGIVATPDYPNALNGLQLANAGGTVRKIASAVDASLPVITAAIAARADLLIVHHGLFWSGAQPVVGPVFEKFRRCVEASLAVYSVHIPLDVHPQLGNNACLARALGLRKTRPFMAWKGIHLGVRARVRLDRDALIARVRSAVGGGRVHVCPAGPQKVARVGIVTGGAGAEVAQASAEGVDTFITGEGPHWTYPLAEELGVNLIYAGHYATETFGVRALAAWLHQRFRLPHEFIDHPTGL